MGQTNPQYASFSRTMPDIPTAYLIYLYSAPNIPTAYLIYLKYALYTNSMSKISTVYI